MRLVEDRIVPLVGVIVLAVGVAYFAKAQPLPSPGNVPAANAEHLANAQLDQLTAPIALYSDPLLGAALAAATYPLEVVEAARWLDDPSHAALKGDALAAALGPQSWDPSVKFLVAFPDVLRMMNNNLEWTDQLGDAFLAQQADVMDSVQRLRQRAAANGSLKSTPQQTISTQESDITIEPTDPDVIYVPYYIPMTVYGPWPWPDYPPYYFPLEPDFFYGGALIGFGIGIGIFEPLWGWYGWNWPGHGITVFPHRPRPGYPPGRNPNLPPRPWQHDPQHRHGVPYGDSATATRYLGQDAASRRPFRGFEPSSAASHPESPVQAPAERDHVASPMTHPMTQSAPLARPTPPAFESFGRGPQVRGEASRGSSSRSAPAASFHGSGGGHR